MFIHSFFCCNQMNTLDTLCSLTCFLIFGTTFHLHTHTLKVCSSLSWNLKDHMIYEAVLMRRRHHVPLIKSRRHQDSAVFDGEMSRLAKWRLIRLNTQSTTVNCAITELIQLRCITTDVHYICSNSCFLKLFPLHGLSQWQSLQHIYRSTVPCFLIQY